MKKVITAGILAAALGMGLSAAMPMQAEAKLNLDTYFDFEAHRGGRDARPENTLYSYAYAIEMGATSIECDMQLTADGRIVMSHNPILNGEITRGADGKYLTAADKFDMRTMTVEEIKKFNVASVNPATEYYGLHGATQVVPERAEVPTLEELLQLIKDSGSDIYLNIETKSYPDPEDPNSVNNADPKNFVETFNSIVQKYNMEDRVLLQSFDWQTLVEMKKVNPNIATSALWSQQPTWGRDGEYLRPYEKEKSPYLAGMHIDKYKGHAVWAAHAINADVVSPYYMEVSKEMVEDAHALGMKVVPWTVNDVTDMEMLYAMGVDGMISDKPWVLREFLEKKGAKLRPTMKIADKKYHLEPNHVEVAVTDKVKGGADAAY